MALTDALVLPLSVPLPARGVLPVPVPLSALALAQLGLLIDTDLADSGCWGLRPGLGLGWDSGAGMGSQLRRMPWVWLWLRMSRWVVDGAGMLGEGSW